MTLRGNRRRAQSWPPLDKMHHNTTGSTDTPTHADGSPDYLAGALADSPVLRLLEEGRQKYAVVLQEPAREEGDCLQCSTCSGACGQLKLELTKLSQAQQSRNRTREFP